MRARSPEAGRRFPRALHARAASWLTFWSRIALVAAAIVLAAPSLRAAPPTYTGEAPVNSQSDEDRGEALKKALANVIIDVTGDASAPSRPAIAAALAKADRYVLQYRYRPNPAGDPDAAKYTMIADFDSAAVDAMLDQLGLGAAANGTAAPAAEAPSEATVWISGIRSADDYARIIAYLARNNLVQSAEPSEARGDGMLVKLSLETSLARFLDAVGLERTLSVVNAAPPVEGVDATLALVP